MKKIILTILLVVSCAVFLVGCNETYTVQDVTYLGSVQNKDSTTFLKFKDSHGSTHSFISDNNQLISLLSKGSKYNVTAYVGDELNRTDTVEKIIASN